MGTRGSRWKGHALSCFVLLAAVACDSSTGPTKTEVFTGVFRCFGGADSSTGYSSFFLASGGDAEASLTWTVPAAGTRPIADLSFWGFGIPDRLLAQSAASATPPVTLRGSGSYLEVGCSNCRDIAPIPFTLTVKERQ
jgi:hypothetical protein